MKIYSYKKILIFLGINIILIILIYLSHVDNLYANAMGQKNAMRIAHSIVNTYRQEGEIPILFIQDISCLLGDERGVYYDITIESQSEFNIVYKPKSTWFFGLTGNGKEVLEIRWNNNMGDVEVYSNIKRP